MQTETVPSTPKPSAVKKLKPTRYVGQRFEKYVATAYLNKIQNSFDRKIEFNITISAFRNMLMAKKCQLSGVDLTHYGCGLPDGVPGATRRDSDVNLKLKETGSC